MKINYVMDITKVLDNKMMKAVEKRGEIVEAINTGVLSINDISALALKLDIKKITIFLEAMEEITRNNPNIATLEWLLFVQEYLDSLSNNAKREASRIIGNIAHLFPEHLDVSIEKLLDNTSNKGTVIRWGSAYALAKIIVIPKYANSDLFDILKNICDKESENGVKNQYVKALKKAAKDNNIIR